MVDLEFETRCVESVRLFLEDEKVSPSGYKEAWHTLNVQDFFEIHSFNYAVVSVTRKSDGKRGTLLFTNKYPSRVYYGFMERKCAQ